MCSSFLGKRKDNPLGGDGGDFDGGVGARDAYMRDMRGIGKILMQLRKDTETLKQRFNKVFNKK